MSKNNFMVKCRREVFYLVGYQIPYPLSLMHQFGTKETTRWEEIVNQGLSSSRIVRCSVLWICEYTRDETLIKLVPWMSTSLRVS